MKKEIERELKKERNMDIRKGSKVIYRFANGQELSFFRNDELKMDNLELVFHESTFNGLTGKYEDRTKDFEITSRTFEGIVEEIMKINKEYFYRRHAIENSYYCGKIGKRSNM